MFINFYYCNEYSDEINCAVDKNELLKILSYSGESFYLAEKLFPKGWYIFKSVLNITFNYIVNQEIVNIKIGQLLTPIVSKNEFIAYETNIDNVPILTTNYFELNTENNRKLNCIFKKNINRKNLLLLCNTTIEGNYSLGKIKLNVLDKININYNFTIEEFTNNEIYEVSNEGTKIISVFPIELNFTEADSYNITYETEYPEKLKGIKLNINSKSELICENKKVYKICIVNKAHFSKSGNYYTYHTNHKGSKTISYEAPLIKVIYPDKEEKTKEVKKDDDDNLGVIIGVSVTVGVIVLAVIAFLIYHYLRKRNLSNNDVIDSSIPLASKNMD